MRWTAYDGGSTQFEGRSPEEAMARARAALGTTSELRCWKTRRGGIAGFFATEVFVASVEPPPGSEPKGASGPRTPRRGKRGRHGSLPPDAQSKERGLADIDADQAGDWAAALDLARSQDRNARDLGPTDLLSGLVDATSDEVSVRSVSIPPEAFHDVLAQAQAALAPRGPCNETADHQAAPATPAPQPPAHDPTESGIQEPATDPPLPPPLLSSRSVAPPQETSVDPTISRTQRRATAPAANARAIPRARSSSPVRSVERDSDRPAALLPDLRPALTALGLQESCLPRGKQPSLDALVRAIGRVPAAPALPTTAGAVVAIVGPHPYLQRTIDLVVSELTLDRRDVLWTRQDTRGHARQVARRSAAGRTTIVAAEGEPGQSSAALATPLTQIVPDYVLVAVAATAKREDVEHWVDDLEPVDALALWDVDRTRTPAELIGAIPIAFVDGERCSPLAWTVRLVARAMQGR